LNAHKNSQPLLTFSSKNPTYLFIKQFLFIYFIEMIWPVFLTALAVLAPILAYDLSYFPPVDQVPPANATLTKLLLAGKNISTSTGGGFGTPSDDHLGCQSSTEWAISCESQLDFGVDDD
jgi:hypothetical protein